MDDLLHDLEGDVYINIWRCMAALQKVAYYCSNVSKDQNYVTIIPWKGLTYTCEHNENEFYLYQNFPEYDLTAALVLDDVAHQFKRSHQVTGDGNRLYKFLGD